MLALEKSKVYTCWGCALAAVTVCCNVRVTGDQDCGAKGLGACGNLVGVWFRAQHLGGAIGVFRFDRVLALARSLTFQRMSPCVRCFQESGLPPGVPIIRITALESP